MIKLALRSALSDRASEGKVVVVDDWGFDAPKTRDARTALAALGLDGRVLVVIDGHDSAVARSFRNLPEVQLIKAGELNAYDVLCNDWIVFTQAALDRRAERSTRSPVRRGRRAMSTRSPSTTSRSEPRQHDAARRRREHGGRDS